jgi:broad specificity polyphosphatase/5'/3'-nucleotidase SurE
MIAVLEGIPAIAISVGLDLAEAKAEPQHFPSTIAAFPAAAAFTVEVVNALAAAGPELLPAGHMLNINFPVAAGAGHKAARWAPVSRHGGFKLIYPSFENGKIHSWIEVDKAGVLDVQSDTGLFNSGHVTLSLLRPDWQGDADAERLLYKPLETLAAAIAMPAEAP